MLSWIHEQVVQMDCDVRTLRLVELASEEALVNIIHHAYRESPGKIEISVKLFPKSHVEISITDSGPPFNPLEQKVALDHLPLEERKIGGLGIHLIRQCMDDIQYTRERNQNVLVLIKKISH